MQINLPIQEDSIAEKSNVIKEYFAEKLKGNIIIKYFEKLKKKKDIKDSIIQNEIQTSIIKKAAILDKSDKNKKK